MPESSEVRIIAEYLNKHWSGKILIGLVWDLNSKFNRPKTAIKGLNNLLLPINIIRVIPRGKLIIIEGINKIGVTIYMVSQLGMSGKWIKTNDAHTTLTLTISSASNPNELWYYNDVRKFGHFNIYTDMSEVWKKHGPCYLTTSLVINGVIKMNELTPYQSLVYFDDFKLKIKNNRIKTKPICEFLMEQKYFSGVGNYLRVELLYRCKIHPQKPVGTFDDNLIAVLYNTILAQVYLAYIHGGLTIKDYSDPEGNVGTCPLQVYNQTCDPYGNPVVKYQDRQKRTMHWVPVVQTN